jgi:lipopolysaccharide transport system permease protein
MKYFKMPASLVRLLYQNKYMIKTMVVRDIRTRYIGSFLGFFWSVIHPLLQLLIYYFVFAIIFKLRLGPEYGGTSFALWLIAGLLPWMFFSEIMTRAPVAVLEQANLIKKMAFPSEIFPVVHLSSAIISHLIGLGILAILLIMLGYGISLKMIMIVPYLILIGIFALGTSWLISALNVYLRDIGQTIGVFLNIWFFATPIIYPIHLVPKGLLQWYSLNPMLHVVEGYRSALLGKAEMDVLGFTYLFLVSLIVLIVGGLTFKRLKPAFADVL